MKSALIEIHGTGTRNKGAELMACAAATQLRKAKNGIRLAVCPSFGGFEQRARYGFYRLDYFRTPLRSKIFGRIVSDRLMEDFGLARASAAIATVDASGFAFSDQWGPLPPRKLLHRMQTSDRKRQKLILLPQA